MNVSKEKRIQLLYELGQIREFINSFRKDENTQNLLSFVNNLEKDLNRKKYGLIFEEHNEEIDFILEKNVPILIEDKNKLIDNGNNINFLIEGDNLAALHILEKTHFGKVDVIYIDPPYNTGAKDWKYNNDFVDGQDAFRHSKWLSFMYRRLLIARKLLTKNGVLVVAIDDYEYSHLYMLLEDLFNDYDLYTVIVNHHPQGGAAGNITRTHEYAIFVIPKSQVLVKGEKSENIEEHWSLMRGGKDSRNLRVGRPRSFYAIYVDPDSYEVKGVGPSLGVNDTYSTEKSKDGYIPLYPIGKDGTERVWRYERSSMIEHIEKGDIFCSPQLRLGVNKQKDVKYAQVKSLWLDERYNAGTNGTNLLSNLFGGENTFSYPKSLYTVEDTIKYLTQDNKNALILDFFAGSGTTGHATLDLNYQDGGKRHFILCTNNENNICDEITYQRLKTVITGIKKDGSKYSNGYNAGLKYFHIGFISIGEKFYYEYADKLLKHTKELVELENGINFQDNSEIAIVLTDDELESFIKNNNFKNCKKLYIGHDVLTTGEQEQLLRLKNITIIIIPNYYYHNLEA